MSDRPQKVTVDLKTRHALWPGQTHQCIQVYAPKVGAAWYLQDFETGMVSELRAYRAGMFRRGTQQSD